MESFKVSLNAPSLPVSSESRMMNQIIAIEYLEFLYKQIVTKES